MPKKQGVGRIRKKGRQGSDAKRTRSMPTKPDEQMPAAPAVFEANGDALESVEEQVINRLLDRLLEDVVHEFGPAEIAVKASHLRWIDAQARYFEELARSHCDGNEHFSVLEPMPRDCPVCQYLWKECTRWQERYGQQLTELEDMQLMYGESPHYERPFCRCLRPCMCKEPEDDDSIDE